MRSIFVALCFAGFFACGDGPAPDPDPPPNGACILVEEGFGPTGSVSVRAEVVVDGLEVPWGIAFIDEGAMLVTERPGRIRLVQDGTLTDDPVATVSAAVAEGEGGLLGIAAHPDFAANRTFYIYYTADEDGESVNRVERWILAEDRQSASRDGVLLDAIPAAQFHNGGRLRFGPDGMLYVGTGDAGAPDAAQDTSSLAGKLLRLTPEGEAPPDNPFGDNPVYLTGIRNTQGFDWPDDATIWLADHGPSGEMGRTGHDEVSVVEAGANLGWPDIYGCESEEGMVTPSLTWEDAVPPGGAAVYRGEAIPEWEGDLIVGTLGSRHLHRVAFEDDASGQVRQHEVYLQGDAPDGYGRLREVIMGPDDALYVTTSNCDGRGSCPSDGDKILRIVSGEGGS